MRCTGGCRAGRTERCPPAARPRSKRGGLRGQRRRPELRGRRGRDGAQLRYARRPPRRPGRQRGAAPCQPDAGRARGPAGDRKPQRRPADGLAGRHGRVPACRPGRRRVRPARGALPLFGTGFVLPQRRLGHLVRPRGVRSDDADHGDRGHDRLPAQCALPRDHVRDWRGPRRAGTIGMGGVESPGGAGEARK